MKKPTKEQTESVLNFLQNGLGEGAEISIVKGGFKIESVASLFVENNETEFIETLEQFYNFDFAKEFHGFEFAEPFHEPIEFPKVLIVGSGEMQVPEARNYDFEKHTIPLKTFDFDLGKDSFYQEPKASFQKGLPTPEKRKSMKPTSRTFKRKNKK